jgi:hypothetical protein
VDIGRSAQCGVSKSAKKRRSASCGKGVLPIKTGSVKWKVGFVCAQKPFLVITNDKFTREISGHLTVHRPFRTVFDRSAKGRPSLEAEKQAFGMEKNKDILEENNE